MLPRWGHLSGYQTNRATPGSRRGPTNSIALEATISTPCQCSFAQYLSVTVSVCDGERRDAEVHPGPECAHAEVAVQSGSRLGSYAELDIFRDDDAVPAVDALGPGMIQVENRHWLPSDGRGELLGLRIDDEVGKRDALAAVPEGQSPGVSNGSSERLYGDLASADREAERPLRGCRGDSGGGDVGMLEGHRHRGVDDDSGTLTDHRRFGRNVRGGGRCARTRAAGRRGSAA